MSNGAYIDSGSADGLRKCLADDFTSIYCFNLRGNQRTSGEISRKEGGKVFGSGSRAGIAITLLVKNPDAGGQCRIQYHDIGDYLTQKQKLKRITEFSSVRDMEWKRIESNEQFDWIHQRNPEFHAFLALGDKKE